MRQVRTKQKKADNDRIVTSGWNNLLPCLIKKNKEGTSINKKNPAS